MLVTLEILQKTLDKYQEVYQEVEKINDVDNIHNHLYNNNMLDGMCNFIIELLLEEHRFFWNYDLLKEMSVIYKLVLGKSRKKKFNCCWFPVPNQYKTRKGILSSLDKRIQFLKQAVEYGTKNNLWRNS